MNTLNFRVTTDLHASKSNRFLNFVIDTIAYYALSFISGIFLGLLAMIGIEAPLNSIAEGSIGPYVFSFGVFLIYFIVFEVFLQRTLGKYITKTKVVMEDGSKPKASDIIIRSLCRLIPFEVFSFLNDDARGWHDSMSNTYVVDTKKFEAKRTAQSELDKIGKPVI